MLEMAEEQLAERMVGSTIFRLSLVHGVDHALLTDSESNVIAIGLDHYVTIITSRDFIAAVVYFDGVVIADHLSSADVFSDLAN